MRCRRIVGDVVVELSPDGGTVAVVGLSHLPGDNEIVAVQDLRRAAHRYRTGTGLPGGRLVSGEVAVTTDGARQADVGRLSAATGGAATARVKAVVDAVVVVVVIVVDPEAVVASEVGVVEVVEVPLVDESRFSRHSDDL